MFKARKDIWQYDSKITLIDHNFVGVISVIVVTAYEIFWLIKNMIWLFKMWHHFLKFLCLIFVRFAKVMEWLLNKGNLCCLKDKREFMFYNLHNTMVAILQFLILLIINFCTVNVNSYITKVALKIFVIILNFKCT